MEWTEIAAKAVPYALGLLTIPIKNLSIGIWNRLMHDLPYVKGTYQSSYQFHLKGGDVVAADEVIRVQKIGRWIWATAEMRAPLTKRWKIKGEIRGTYLLATVESATRKTLSGKGFILLKAIENGSELSGHMTWIDSKLGAIYSTPYVWKRLDKEDQEG
ncbi:MAG: hypothetical protein ABL909_01370 [Sphingopyxis sp.]